MTPSKMPRNRRVMFPSTHDISPFYLESAVGALHSLLHRGNEVVIVSKPHLVCTRRLCEELKNDASKILFRFTIGSLDESLTRLWEPGAPIPAERLECLKHAFNCGFTTSVSMEPILAGRSDALQTVAAVSPHVTETIWIGRMNGVARRVAKAEPEIRRACATIVGQQSDAEMLALVEALASHPKVRWKDSIRTLMEKKAVKKEVSALMQSA